MVWPCRQINRTLLEASRRVAVNSGMHAASARAMAILLENPLLDDPENQWLLGLLPECYALHQSANMIY